jgi:CDP-diacylglycerol---glycerol-3-phosphate 3-phosphatidyltransferase
MGIYSVKPRFQHALGGVEDALVRRRVHPDYITFLALLISLLGGVALYGATWFAPLLLVVPLIVLARTALNALDGLVARRTGLARPWGEVLNECCDRLSDVALFVGLMFAPGSNVALGAAALVLMLLSSYIGTAAKAAGGHRQYGGIMGKADRMIYLGVAVLLAFLLPHVPVLTCFLILALVGLFITIVQRLRATYDDLKSPS